MLCCQSCKEILTTRIDIAGALRQLFICLALASLPFWRPKPRLVGRHFDLNGSDDGFLCHDFSHYFGLFAVARQAKQTVVSARYE